MGLYKAIGRYIILSGSILAYLWSGKWYLERLARSSVALDLALCPYSIDITNEHFYVEKAVESRKMLVQDSVGPSFVVVPGGWCFGGTLGVSPKI